MCILSSHSRRAVWFALVLLLSLSTTAVFSQTAPRYAKPSASSDVNLPSAFAVQALIFDGSFENQPSGWSTWSRPASCSSIGDWESTTRIPSYDGARYLWGGGYCNGRPTSNFAAQQIEIDTSQTILSFYYYSDRQDEDSNSTDDYGYLSLDGQTIWELPLTLANNSSGWQNVQLPITDFSGSMVELRIGANSGNQSGVGNIFFDQIELIATELTLSVTPDEQTIAPNGTATFTVSLTNEGEVALSALEIEATVEDCAASYDSIDVSETISYDCTIDDVDGSLTNFVNATAIGPLDIEVEASAEADVLVSEPGISVTISPESQTIYEGETADFSLTITNTGNEPADNVGVSSNTAPNCNTNLDSLAAGASHEIDCDRPGVLDDFTNLVTVTAVSSLGETLNDEDTSMVTVIRPSISISKTPDNQTRLAGETAVFQITVTNNGDTPLTNLEITDSVVDDCHSSRDYLAPQSNFTYACEEEDVQNSFNSEATVIAEDSLGNELSDSDAAFVEVSNLNLRIFISPDEQTIISGERANFSILVFNLSNRPLENVAVSVPNLPACDNSSIGSLAPQGSDGDSVSYSCEGIISTAQTIEATVTATAGSNTVQDSAAAQVNILELTAQLTSLVDSIDEPGGMVDYTLRIVNEGNQPLTLTGISSPQLGNLNNVNPNVGVSNNSCTIGQDIAAGESYSCTYSGNINGQPGLYEVTVNVTAEGDEETILVTSAATAMLINDLPSSLRIQTAATPATITAPEGNVSFEVVLTNQSSVDAITVNQIFSSLAGTLSNKGSCALPKTLAPQESYRCQYSANVQGNPNSQQINALTAEGVDDDEQNVTAETAVAVQVVAPPIFQVYVPLVQHLSIISEPNDNCPQAFPIGPNQPHQFLPDDVEDWYVVDVPRTGAVTFTLSNFTPQNGQMVVYKGESCGSATLVGNDGSFESLKQVSLPRQAPGRYFIYIINDGLPSTTNPYTLTVQIN